MMRISSSRPLEAPLSALTRAVAPAQVHISYSATNALPFRVEWEAETGPKMFFGLTPEQAAEAAHASLARGSSGGEIRVTEPSGNSPWAEAMRERIADLDAERTPSPPKLHLIRGGR